MLVSKSHGLREKKWIILVLVLVQALVLVLVHLKEGDRLIEIEGEIIMIIIIKNGKKCLRRTGLF